MQRRTLCVAATAIAAGGPALALRPAQPSAPASGPAAAGGASSTSATSAPSPAAGTADDPIRWPLATGYRADGFHARNLQQLADELREATRGGLLLEIKPDNQLLPMAQIPEAVASGRLPAGEAIMTGMAKRWPVAGADAVPFLTGNYDDALRLWQHQRPVLEKALAADGLSVLLAVPWPAQGLYSTRPIRSAEDIKGSRMRTYNASTQRIAELLGATPVELPMAQVGQALAEGRIDSMITSAVTGVEQQVWQWLRHYYDINAWLPKNLVMANSRALAALPNAHRQALLRLAGVAEERGWAASRQAARQSLATLQDKQMQTEATPALLAPTLRRLGERFSRDWIREVGPEANAIFVPYYTHSAPKR